jgi:hypothetical protein
VELFGEEVRSKTSGLKPILKEYVYRSGKPLRHPKTEFSRKV